MDANGSSVSNSEVENCMITLDRINYNQAYYDPSQNVVICYTEEQNPETASASPSKERCSEVSRMETVEHELVPNGEFDSNSYYPELIKLKAALQRLFVQKKAVIVKKTVSGAAKKLVDVWNFFGDVRLFISEAEAERLHIPYTIKYTDKQMTKAFMILKSFVGCFGCKRLFMFDGSKTTTLRCHIKSCSMPKKEKSKKRGRTSPAWNYFSKLGDQRAMCNMCDQVISYKGGGPFNLTRHLKGKHGKNLKGEVLKPVAEESSSSSDNEPSWKPTGEESDGMDSDHVKKTKSRKRSVAWEFFTEVGPFKAVCNLCNKVMSYKGGGPYNLIRHIKSRHGEHLKGRHLGELTSDSLVQNVDFAVPVQQTFTLVPQVIDSVVPAPSISSEDYVTRSLVALVCKHYLPFSLIESGSFKEMVRLLNPSYLLPSKMTLSTTLLDRYYAAEKEKVQKELQEADYIALTVEGWRSITEESYLCLTAHFINSNTELKSFLLECFQCSKEDSDVNLKEKIELTCEEWGIKRKVVCATTDNQDTIEMAVKIMGVDHVSCFAHILNQTVVTALENIESMRSSVKAVVEHFKCTPLALKKLKTMQIQQGKNSPKLVNDINTMWDSTFDMFESVIDVKENLVTMINQDYPELPELDDHIFCTLKSINELLAIFKSVTEEISSENKVTVSEVIILSNVLVSKCRKFLLNNSTAPEINTMALTLVKSLEAHFSKIEENKIFSVATILDPRFKKHGFKDNFTYEQAVLDVKQMAGDIDLHSNENEMENDFLNDEAEPIKDKEGSIWDDFDRTAEEISENVNPNAAGSIETDKYLQEPLLKRTLDPLKWWHGKRNVYPRLYQLVKQRMCIAASSIPSEKLFSKSGRLLTEKRNSLSGGMVPKVVFLNCNM